MIYEYITLQISASFNLKRNIMFVVVSLPVYIGGLIGKYVGKAILGLLCLAGLILIGLLKAAGKILTLLFKYIPIWASWAYAEFCLFYQKYKTVKDENRTLTP